MPQIGSFTLLLALALASYSFVAGVLALYRKDDRLTETARRAGIACWAAVTVASVALVMAAFGNDFSVAYIMHHSNRDLPIAYKFAALWSGQEGSLLLWAWLLSTYGLVMRLRYKVDPQLTAYASAIVAAVQIFFLLLVNFAAHPFGLVKGTIPADGNGLNPLLQYPEMVIHPPMLYLGYVGVTAPFAFALGALIMKYPGEKWIHITRRWTMVAWLFLTVGIFLGAHWAYAVLGWGGYWGWDPVENASILPWLTMTAFLHSVMMQEKRGMMKMWNMWLIFITFLLAIFGTFLDPQRRGQLGACVRAIGHRDLVRVVPVHRVRDLRLLLRTQPRDAEKRASPGFADLPRIELPVQQPGAAGGLFRSALGHAVPSVVGVGHGQQSHGWPAVL